MRRCWKGDNPFFFEIDLTSRYITEIVAQRSGDLHIKNFMQPSARLLICATCPPEAHEFDTPFVSDKKITEKYSQAGLDETNTFGYRHCKTAVFFL